MLKTASSFVLGSKASRVPIASLKAMGANSRGYASGAFIACGLRWRTILSILNDKE